MNEVKEIKNNKFNSVEWSNKVIFEVFCNDDLDTVPNKILRIMIKHLESKIK